MSTKRSRARVKVRPWTAEDIPQVIEVQKAAWSDYTADDQYGERTFRLAFAAFPEGQLLAETPNGRIVGYATSLIVQLEEDVASYSYNELTGAGTFSSHDPLGDTLYGSDIAVHPDFRGRGVASRLYDARKRLLRRYNLRRMIAFGRIPGYREHAGKLTAREYVDEVIAGERGDPALSAHLAAGYQVREVKLNLMSDRASNNWATVLEMTDERFNPARRQISAAPLARAFRKARVCAAQYQMRPAASWTDVTESIDFFGDVASEYHCHILVFPELFTARWLTSLGPFDSRDAMASLAEKHPSYLEHMTALARRTGLYVVGGSHPVRRDGALYNVAHLFSPAGNVYTQDKLHVTPTEREVWGIRPGSGLSVFATALGTFSILICYDIEFPELARLVTFAGAEAIFVPFSTDDRKAYARVRYTAAARAVENMVYVALAGNTGNLHTSTYLLNYAESVVLTPSDYGFPPQAIAAAAEQNVESVAIADLDFASLSAAREMGSVRPLQDLRTDIYDLGAVERVRRVSVE
jgi:predicted amidohydrolase/ribosomal protein S18 acetylase RimI-like enzyme